MNKYMKIALEEAREGIRLGTFDLSGCELYTTGEPCHMCLCASMWANISKIYYGCTTQDNGMIGFRDDKFDKIFGGREKLGDYMVNSTYHNYGSFWTLLLWVTVI